MSEENKEKSQPIVQGNEGESQPIIKGNQEGILNGPPAPPAPPLHDNKQSESLDKSEKPTDSTGPRKTDE